MQCLKVSREVLTNKTPHKYMGRPKSCKKRRRCSWHFIALDCDVVWDQSFHAFCSNDSDPWGELMVDVFWYSPDGLGCCQSGMYVVMTSGNTDPIPTEIASDQRSCTLTIILGRSKYWYFSISWPRFAILARSIRSKVLHSSGALSST